MDKKTWWNSDFDSPALIRTLVQTLILLVCFHGETKRLTWSQWWEAFVRVWSSLLTLRLYYQPVNPLMWEKSFSGAITTLGLMLTRQQVYSRMSAVTLTYSELVEAPRVLKGVYTWAGNSSCRWIYAALNRRSTLESNELKRKEPVLKCAAEKQKGLFTERRVNTATWANYFFDSVSRCLCKGWKFWRNSIISSRVRWNQRAAERNLVSSFLPKHKLIPERVLKTV